MTTERTTLIDQLLDAGRHLVTRGLVQASGGNLSVRLPGTDHFLVTGSGTWLDRLTADDLVELTLHGERVSGAQRPSVEWKLHQRTYAVRPDVQAVIHLHPQHVLLVDMLGAPIRFTTLDHQFYLGSAGRVPFHPAGSQEIADAAADAVRDHDAVGISRITTIHPRTYNEAKVIGENFREGIPVIMNLTDMDDADAKRLVDFAAGLVFGLHGSIERVTSKVFLLSPETVEVNAEEQAAAAPARGLFNQS